MVLVVSGATGFLGTALVEHAGSSAVTAIVRGTDWERRAARLRRRAPELGCVPGDVTQPLWGLDEPTLDRLAGEVDAVVNLAAETSWSAPWYRLETTNIEGAGRAADIAARLGAWLLHVSSLYVGYDYADEVHPALLDERPVLSRYERSKCRGEWAVIDRCRELGVPVRIVRVGTLIGDARPPAGARSAAAQVPFLRTFAYLPRQGWRVLPYVEGARLDTMPRDVTARALAAHAVKPPADEVEVDHVALGHDAPLAGVVLAEIADWLRRTGRPSFVPVRVPARTLRAMSVYGDRFGQGPWAAAWIGMRYMADRSVYLGSTPMGEDVSLRSLRTALGLEHEAVAPNHFYEDWLS